MWGAHSTRIGPLRGVPATHRWAPALLSVVGSRCKQQPHTAWCLVPAGSTLAKGSAAGGGAQAAAAPLSQQRQPVRRVEEWEHQRERAPPPPPAAAPAFAGACALQAAASTRAPPTTPCSAAALLQLEVQDSTCTQPPSPAHNPHPGTEAAFAVGHLHPRPEPQPAAPRQRTHPCCPHTPPPKHSHPHKQRSRLGTLTRALSRAACCTQAVHAAPCCCSHTPPPKHAHPQKQRSRLGILVRAVSRSLSRAGSSPAMGSESLPAAVGARLQSMELVSAGRLL